MEISLGVLPHRQMIFSDDGICVVWGPSLRFGQTLQAPFDISNVSFLDEFHHRWCPWPRLKRSGVVLLMSNECHPTGRVLFISRVSAGRTTTGWVVNRGIEHRIPRVCTHSHACALLRLEPVPSNFGGRFVEVGEGRNICRQNAPVPCSSKPSV